MKRRRIGNHGRYVEAAESDNWHVIFNCDSDRCAEEELVADANLGADARAAAGHYPGTPAELIEQLRRELDSALQREVKALRKAADFKIALDGALQQAAKDKALIEAYESDLKDAIGYVP